MATGDSSYSVKGRPQLRRGGGAGGLAGGGDKSPSVKEGEEGGGRLYGALVSCSIDDYL